MRFIHCADLHLGCRQFDLGERCDDFFAAFSYIIDKTLEADADALVIAGDLFHHRSIEAFTLERTARELERLRDAGIRVFLTEGNHDKQHYTEVRSWCAYLGTVGLVTLLNNGDAAEYMGVRFVGLGFCGSLAKSRIAECAESLGLLPSRPTVLLLHAGVNYMANMDGSLRYSDIECLKELVDYAALGHIHRPYTLDGWLFNPGSSENVHLSEADYGERGYFDVAIDQYGVKAKLCPVPMREVRAFSFDLSDTNEILTQLPDDLSGCILRLSLNTEAAVDTPALREAVKAQKGCLYTDIAVNGEYARQEYDELPGLSVLEQSVLTQMARDAGFDDPDAACRIIRGLKESLLNGEAPENIASSLYKEFSDENQQSHT